jgi:V-type H+-transporting ATPase subunit D
MSKAAILPSRMNL